MLLSRAALQKRKPARAGRPAWKTEIQYKRWLRKLPCACCGQLDGGLRDPIVAAHVDHAGKGTRDAKGIGSKAADKFCIPLLDSCHKRQHTLGWKSFEKHLPGGDAEVLANEYFERWLATDGRERDQ